MRSDERFIERAPLESQQADVERRANERRMQMMDDIDRQAMQPHDNGIQEVDVRDLPYPEGISGADDFQKVSPDEMADGLRKLDLMKPYIESGEGASADYWADVDQRYGVAYPDGYQKVYESFYGDEPIRLTKVGDNYDIENGRHRIWIAKELGWQKIPARVIEYR